MNARVRRGLTVVGAGLLVTAASVASPAAARNCLPEVIAAEHAIYGTTWGREAVSQLARHAEEFGFARLGEVASTLARTPAGECPPVE